MIKNLFINQPSEDPPPFTAFISPSFYSVNVPNGNYTTPAFEGSAIGGQEPYTYSWVINNGTIQRPNNNQTSFTLSGYNRAMLAKATLTVTDDNSDTVTANLIIQIDFGTIL